MSAVLRSEAEAKYPYRNTAGVDYKAWAKRIIYREERGDKDLLMVQVRFAKEALNINEEEK